MPQPAWPAAVVNDLNNQYFREASIQLGVDETNDFIYGGLHIALRRMIYDLLVGGAVVDAMAFANLPDAPAVRFELRVPPVAVLEDWLASPALASRNKLCGTSFGGTSGSAKSKRSLAHSCSTSSVRHNCLSRRRAPPRRNPPR
jgi:hypothetical protein